MTREIIGQSLGLVAAAITILSYQVNQKGKLLLLQTSATLLHCLAYFFLGAAAGFLLNIVCILRNVIFYFQPSQTKASYATACVLSAVMLAVGAFSWQGPVSLLMMIPLPINTVFLSMGNPQTLRKSVLFTSSMILFYNIFVFSLGGILNEAVAILSSIVGILRFRTDKRFGGEKGA